MSAQQITETQAEHGYTTRTFRIADIRIDLAMKKLQQLSKRAESIGMPAFGLELGEPYFVIAAGEYGMIGGRLKMFPLTVTGGAPVIPGWNFFAKIDHEDGANVVRGFGASRAVENDPVLLKELQTCPPNCDHCSVKRARNTTFLFEKTDNPGERIQVGSTCVADFSGHKTPDQLVSLATRWCELSDEFYNDEGDIGPTSSGRSRNFDVESVLAAGLAVVRKDGHWISREAAGDFGNSSVDMVQQLLTNPKIYINLVEEKDKAAAKEISDWLCSDNYDVKGSLFRSNLQAIAMRGDVPFKMTGFLSSAVAVWHNDQADLQKKKANPVVSMKLGNCDEKLTLSAKVEKIIVLENDFGTSDMTILKDTASQAKMIWFNSGKRTMFEGDTYHITGMVKSHEERDGVWQTKLSRVNSSEAALQKLISINPTFSKPFEKKLQAVIHIDARDQTGNTALFNASLSYSNGQADRKVVVALVAAGADPSIQCGQNDACSFDQWVVAGDSELIRRGIESHPELTKAWGREMLAAMDRLSPKDAELILATWEQILIQSPVNKPELEPEPLADTPVVSDDQPKGEVGIDDQFDEDLTFLRIG
ncbi:hypothetical protein [Marinobacter sp. ELB17]|uniref:hypothetical protein n=1 Tax=Marinobacter sp. ELB17 TaxID=270374 RepID=UPI0000F381FD|nr:hypothetical protein [Marinobacter sp. ELB17]EAZ98141.1 hypothetical protein MELB17_09663 [Marinobacter sp. ELB17]